MSHILNHNRTPFDFKLDRSESWDFFLSQDLIGGSYGNEGELTEHCLSSYIDISNDDCVTDDSLNSLSGYSWGDAISNGVTLHNIGLTGVDNGFITFDKDKITNKQFLELFTESNYSINEGDNRLHLYKVSGNNKLFDYGNEIIVDGAGNRVSMLNGGFYQGFFKSGCDYHILPSNVGEGLSFEFTFKKTDDVIDDNSYSLNDRYPDNKGTFFFIGTRAENKWCVNYDPQRQFENIFNDYYADDYFADGYLGHCEDTNYFIESKPITYSSDDYFSDAYGDPDECEKEGCCGYDKPSSCNNGCGVIMTYPEVLNTYESNTLWRTTCGGVWVEDQDETMRYKKPGCWCNKTKCKCDDYFTDGYLKEKFEKCNCNIYSSDEYSVPCEDIQLPSMSEITTTDGHRLDEANVIEFKSDNKFIMFDRTCDGFTVDNWVDGSEVVVKDIRMPKDENYFITFHRGCGGMTVDRFKHENKRYNVLRDIYRNAFSLQVRDDGSIGFNYLVRDCDSEEENVKIESGFSKSGIIHENEWVTVHVAIKPIGIVYGKDTVATSFSQKMMIYIYVNGKLVYVSGELPTFNFKELDDMPDKQEGVPFNISVGGGTQGLVDVIYMDYKKLPDKQLFLEKYFGGSFIGYFKSFKVYSCALSLSEIRNNFQYEKNILS